MIHTLMSYSNEGGQINAVFAGEASDSIHRALDKGGRVLINFDFHESLGFKEFRGGYIYGELLCADHIYNIGVYYRLVMTQIDGDFV